MPVKGNGNCHNSDPLTFNKIIRFVNFLNKYYSLGKVHITGGEPLLRPGIVDFIEKISKAGIEDIALTTNGQLLGDMARDLKRAGLRRVNISLDSLNPVNFSQLTHSGELSCTLNGIEAAIYSGFDPIKLNTVVLKGINEHEVVDIVRYGLERNCQVRFLELMPIGVSAKFFNEWFFSSADVKKMLETKVEFLEKRCQSGSSSRNYFVRYEKGLTGLIGFISPYTAPFCSGCRRLRLTADGKLIGCLAQNKSINLREIIHEDKALNYRMTEAVESALNVKKMSPHFDTDMAMVSIGG